MPDLSVLPSATVLAHPQGSAALLGLLALTLRLQPHELRGEGVKHELCCEIAKYTVTIFIQLPATTCGPGHRARKSPLALIRGQTLHAAGRQLAALVETLHPSDPVAADAAGTGAAAAAAELAVLPKRTVEYAGVLLELVYSTVRKARRLANTMEGPAAQQLCEDLAAALEGSQVMEHAGRALLLLFLHLKGLQPPASQLLKTAAIEASQAHWEIATAGDTVSDDPGAQLAMQRTRAVGSGRCVQHAALCLGLAVLCDADGGPACGLPPALRVALPRGDEDSPASRTLGPLAAGHLLGMASMLQLGVQRLGRAPPGTVGRRATLALLMRVARLAVAATNGEAELLTLQPQRPPVPAAALDGGLLPCLERLLRRAGRDLHGPKAAIVQQLHKGACAKAGLWSYLGPLLAYGELHQAAALVATLRKLLRTVDPQVLSAESGGSEASTQQCFVDMAWAILDAAHSSECTPYPAAAAADDGPSPPSQQLLRLLSFAACQLLPELSRMASRLLMPAAASGPFDPDLLTVVLKWIPVLARRCGYAPCSPSASSPDELGGHAGSGMLGDPSRGEAAGRDEGGWRSLLLEEVGAVPLLDAALRLVPRLGERLAERRRLHLLRYLVAVCSVIATLITGAVPVAAEGYGGPSSEQPAGRPGGAPPTASAADAEQGARSSTARGCAGGVSSQPVVAGESGTPAPNVPNVPTGAPTSSSPLPWRPELLREAAAQLRPSEFHYFASRAEGLAKLLELGSMAVPTAWERRASERRPWPLADALPTPAGARRLLPGRCANPSCANLEGDSEAGLALKACSGCGAVGYCCRPCQTAHWRAGHKDACGRRKDAAV
ncbi:hypothetical protein GPECTOR_58g589 [Gonium pectorale]|uniref:phytol kinase n=1 Tax=Gonium pectorale TaxID=33097 RepID=A0A150G724_GONPE|nr:hypothetical protein GPECTOR_58g589 [Gonium pectorale]|eukprot:KXZ45140.1 hypothetical protein GPECTOR_58g589 [Gonium pectorale]